MRSETSGESTVRSNLVGNAGSRPISEAKQPWACPVLGWGTTGEAHVLYSTSQKNHMMVSGLRSARSGALPHLAVFAAESPVCLPSLSSLLSLPSLDHFSLYLVSTCDFGLAVVCLSRCGSIPPRPLLSLSYPSPPPTRVGTCLLFQVSSFKLLGLEYPPCPPLPPRAALSRILGASLLGHSPHRISPPSVPLLCGVNGERDSDLRQSLMAPPPHSLSEHLFASSHHPLPPSPSVCVCVNGGSWI